MVTLISVVEAKQTSGGWAEPANLSRSAGTSQPQVVVDWQGHAHAIWMNKDNSFYYSRTDITGWSPASAIELPFGTRRFDLDLDENDPTPLYKPQLIADQTGNIHSLWLDADGRLFHSRVPAAEFGQFESWLSPLLLADSAIKMQMTIDEDGARHLVYLRSISSGQFPAGLYYRQSTDGGFTWSSPRQLYISPYFQNVSIDQANIQISTAGSDNVVVSWEDPIQETISVINSNDGGQSWVPATFVDQREAGDTFESLGPGNLAMASAGESILMIWQAGHQGAQCDRYFQSSIDGGSTWQPKSEMNSEISECATDLILFGDRQGGLILVDTTESAVHISIWNGEAWSQPATERILSSFTNPVTFRTIKFSCMEPAITGTGTESEPYSLIIVGCELNLDVWALSADLNALKQRIAPIAKSPWQRAEYLATTDQDSSLSLVGDGNGRLHAFWVDGPASEESGATISYSRWDGSSWSSGRPVLTASTDNPLVSPSILFAPPDMLEAVWASSNPGGLQFSQVNDNLAAVAAEWSIPIDLPVIREAAYSPDLGVDKNGNSYVVYAIPLNEDRGIYLTASFDGGESWTESSVIFDAASEGWEMVDKPRIAIGDNGTIHVMWIRMGSPPSAKPLSVHYAASTDSGLTWSDANLIAEGSISWAKPLVSGDRVVHRLWNDLNDGLWHDQSIDSGLNWGQIRRLTSNLTNLQSFNATVDAAGRLNLAAVVIEEKENERPHAFLRHWTFIGDQWEAGESLEIGSAIGGELAIATTSDGTLAVLYGGMADSGDDSQHLQGIYSTYRHIDLPEFTPTPLPTFTPSPPSQPTAMPTQTPAPTATAFFPLEDNQLDGLPIPIDTSDPFIGPLVGVIPAALLIVVAFFVVVRIVRSDRR